jgi:hypothetical protein
MGPRLHHLDRGRPHLHDQGQRKPTLGCALGLRPSILHPLERRRRW